MLSRRLTQIEARHHFFLRKPSVISPARNLLVESLAGFLKRCVSAANDLQQHVPRKAHGSTTHSREHHGTDERHPDADVAATGRLWLAVGFYPPTAVSATSACGVRHVAKTIRCDRGGWSAKFPGQRHFAAFLSSLASKAFWTDIDLATLVPDQTAPIGGVSPKIVHTPLVSEAPKGTLSWQPV